MKKRAVTGFFVFASEKRESVAGELRAASENAAVPAVSRLLGQRWRDLPEEQKAVYKAKAVEKQKEQELMQECENEKQEDKERAEDGAPPPGFSTGSIKKIMTTDEEVKRVSAESVHVMSKGVELFLGYMVEKSLEHARREKRKLIKPSDIETALHVDPKLKNTQALDFVAHVRRRVSGKAADGSGQCGDDGNMEVDEKPPGAKRSKKADSRTRLSNDGTQSKTITRFFKPQE